MKTCTYKQDDELTVKHQIFYVLQLASVYSFENLNKLSRRKKKLVDVKKNYLRNEYQQKKYLFYLDFFHFEMQKK